ncbi:MAG: glycosyltransferase family 4 protein [Actinomycetota bacterium]|nr:glycosyltransferase family 4 protein [Actinomycetota bacterium]
MAHLLVTNDFPPKVGGIQSYLWELWRRLPPGEVTVLTTSHEGHASFDHSQAFRIERVPERVLLPTPALARRVDGLAEELDAAVIVLDPALPLGLLGRRLRRPYALAVHGAEVTVPARLPATRSLLRRVLTGAVHVIASGAYVAAEVGRLAGPTLPVTVVPPGVDTERFRPLDPGQRAAARAGFGLPIDARLVVGVSRLVPRKGFDVLVRASELLASSRSDLVVAIAGGGRQAAALARSVARTGAPVRLLGEVAHASLPLLVGASDVFAVPCRNRWAGLEQEGFGIVFLEGAAVGVPVVAGRSGGTPEAVSHAETGLVVDRPWDATAVAAAIGLLLDDPDLRRRMGHRGRSRVVDHFRYDVLAAQLQASLAAMGG